MAKLLIIPIEERTMYFYHKNKWWFRWNDTTTISEIEELLRV